MQRDKATQEMLGTVSPENIPRLLDVLIKKEKLDVDGITDNKLLAIVMGAYIRNAQYERFETNTLIAARIAAKLGDKDKSNELYETAISSYEGRGMPGAAGLIVLERGNVHRAEHLIQRQFNIYDRGSTEHNYVSFSDAAAFALRIGDKDKAMGYYERGKNWEKAAEIANELGHKEKAILLHLKDEHGDHHFAKAAEIAMSMGNAERAYSLYEQQIKFYESRQTRFGLMTYYYCAQVAEKIGDPERAMAFYERSKDFEAAGNAALKAGHQDEAAILFERQIKKYEDNGLYGAAAAMAERVNQNERADNLKALDEMLR